MKNENFKQQWLKGDIKIYVEKVRVEGNGVILLTGPSSCGKGEIAKSLRRFLSLPEERHLSMGEILRRTVVKTRSDNSFKENLANKYQISYKSSIFDNTVNGAEVIGKAKEYEKEVMSYFNKGGEDISQLDWLEFCVQRGLLVPDLWTEGIIESVFESSPELKSGIFILDGYPRTVAAAKFLLNTLSKNNIPIIKVLHLSITKEQMKIRAQGRARKDDTEDSLERRYQFYVDKVQPCVDYLKCSLGVPNVVLIDAHQPVFDGEGNLDLDASIREVTLTVMQALGLPGFLLDLE